LRPFSHCEERSDAAIQPGLLRFARNDGSMTDVQTHYWTASDGIRLAWRETGDGRPAVLVHGLFSATTNWF
jgi:hypothetical protein